MGSLRQALSLIVSGLLVFSEGFAQSQAPSSPPPSQTPSQKPRPDLKRARRAAERAEKAEAAGRFEEALAALEEAARYAPQDIHFAARAEALRSRLVRAYSDAAERDALANRFDQAAEDLTAALAIDPANTLLLERLRQIKSMEDEAAPRAASQIPGLPHLKPQPGKHDLDLRGDTKTVYEQVANTFGVRATFDPDLLVRNVHLNVNDVDFNNAVTILAAQTATFWRPLNETLMFVAADTPEKRREYDLEAEQTFPLSAAVTPEDATEVLRIVRDLTGSPHIDLDAHSHAITMRDTPQRLALAGALIQQMERARGELMLEIELLEVDRNTARKLGVEPPTRQRLIALPLNLINQLTQANNLTALQSLLAGIFGTAATAGTTSVSSLIPPLVAIGGGKSTFLLTLPSAAADFSDALSLVQSGRQVLLRAQDGKPATFFVGQRFPVTLSLLSGSLGTTSFTPNPGGASNPFPSTSFPAGTGPAALVAADFLNNGLIDLAAVNEIDNSVTVLLNQSGNQGTFSQATGSPISLGTARAAAPTTHPGIASATFTTSGCHDLIASDPLANVVNVLISNCDGTFQKPVVIPVGFNPTAIATGDFNGDGQQDFAVANEGDDSISIFLGDGTGKFTAAPNSPFLFSKQFAISTTSLPDGVLNAPYTATLQSTGGTGAVTWSIATGTLPAGLTLNATTGAITGTPTAAGTSPITVMATDSATPPNSATTALSITVNSVAPALAISTASLPNGSLGTPYDQILTVTGGTSPFTWGVPSGPLPTGLSLNATTGEITGTPTSTTTTPASFTFTVSVTDSSATPLTAQKQFTLTPITAAERGPVAMAASDFDSDGKQDLAIVNHETNNVTILLSNRNGDGTFTEATGSPISSGIGNAPVAIAAGDLNGDSMPDLAVVNQADSTLSILLNNGAGTFAPGPSPLLQTAASPTGVAIADFNQDGFADIAVTNGGANSFSVFVGLSGGLFTQAFQPPAGPTGSTPTAIVAGTFATGGFPDVAITNNVSGAAGDITVVLSPASLFTNGVAPGVLQQPYPASEYVDLGLKIKATPTLHPNSEVTLQLEFEIRALSGTNVNGIPILSNRTLSQTVRVKENEPTLISGMTDTEETRSIAGLPGFAEVPVLRYAFSSKNRTFQDTELLIVITPRRLRLADHLTRTIYAGRGDVGRGAFGPGFRGTPGLPVPQPPQPQPQRPLEQPPLQPQPQPQQPERPQP
ncbi:MAG TPA: FG-GAP-like repeat-containing protein [Candidatus Acidoferrum sp.]